MSDCSLYVCHECLELFLFEDSLKDHKSVTGHKASSVLKSQLAVIEDRTFVFTELP